MLGWVSRMSTLVYGLFEDILVHLKSTAMILVGS
jgi:hypothetical protein